MGSWLTCRCGALLHTNMFAGTGIAAVASEEFLDRPREGKNLEDFVTEMIVELPKMLTCRPCGRISILRYENGQPSVSTFVPEAE